MERPAGINEAPSELQPPGADRPHRNAARVLCAADATGGGRIGSRTRVTTTADQAPRIGGIKPHSRVTTKDAQAQRSINFGSVQKETQTILRRKRICRADFRLSRCHGLRHRLRLHQRQRLGRGGGNGIARDRKGAGRRHAAQFATVQTWRPIWQRPEVRA